MFPNASFCKAFRTSSGVIVGSRCKYNATVPATNGAAPDVPLALILAVLVPILADFKFVPGANKSTHRP